MTEAIPQHKLLAMGKSIEKSSPSPSSKSVKTPGGGGSGPKPAAKQY